MIDRRDITGVILCGGGARRMHGVEKPLQLLANRPLVAHVRERLAPQVSRVIISANREHDAYGQWGDVVMADDVPELGPLGGLVSVLGAVTTPLVFCCPGDAPFLDVHVVSRLADSIDSDAIRLRIPHDGVRTQHLFMLVRTSERASIAAYLHEGGRAVHAWSASRSTSIVDASDIAASFRNINTGAELVSAASAITYSSD